jgi:hypothetical protein
MEAMVARAKPGVKEYELKAAAAFRHHGRRRRHRLSHHRLNADGQSGADFRQPAPSGRVLKKGDMVNMELAAGYRGYTAQIGSPITLGPPTDMVRKFWEEITLPGYNKIVAEMLPGKNAEAMRTRASSSATRACSRADPVPRHRHRHRQSAHHLGPYRRHRERHGAQARHDHHGGAQPDHRRRHVRHLPRPHLHHHRHRPRGAWTIFRWKSLWRAEPAGRSANR